MRNNFLLTLIISIHVFTFILSSVFSSLTTNKASNSTNSTLSQANDHLTLALLQNLELGQLKEQNNSVDDQNILLSPFSLGSTLTMLLAGAKNETYAQIFNTLG